MAKKIVVDKSQLAFNTISGAGKGAKSTTVASDMVSDSALFSSPRTKLGKKGKNIEDELLNEEGAVVDAEQEIVSDSFYADPEYEILLAQADVTLPPSATAPVITGGQGAGFFAGQAFGWVVAGTGVVIAGAGISSALSDDDDDDDGVRDDIVTSNEAPVITSGTTGSVTENAAISTVIYDANATDPEGVPLTYSLKPGTGDIAALNINASTGEVTLKAPADFETKTSYSFTVVASDGTNSSEQAVIVNVTNVNEVPVITSVATGTVPENAAISTVIYDANATDVDAGQTLTYSLSGTDAAAFAVDSATGVVTLIAPADYETKKIYNINVVATDNGTGALSATQAVTIDVTDRFELYHEPGVIDALGAEPGVLRLTVAVDKPVSNITVISSIADNVSLDVTPVPDTVVTLIDSTISVQANAEDSSTTLQIQNATGTVTALNVSAAGVSADAYVDIYTDGPLEINAINVEASGNATDGMNYSYANADIRGDVTLGDFITITASGFSAEASLYTDSSVFTDVPGGITVTASGHSSDAYMNVYNASGTVSSITVEATGVSAEADVYIAASSAPDDVLSLGDVTVTASGVGASADVYLDGVNFNDSVINVTSSNYESYAQFNVDAASGTISTLTVEAIGSYDTSADVSISALSPGSLSLGDVTISAASGNYTSASAELNNVTFNNAAISVTAYGDADAGLSANNADGTVQGITVTAITSSYLNYISDGFNDAYDDGNYIKSQFSSYIPYADTVTADDSFGVGSKYVVNTDHTAIFNLIVTGNQSDIFRVTGNMGADGSGSEDIVVLGNYKGYQAFSYRTHSAAGDPGDPSINRVFIYQQNAAVSFNPLDGNTDSEDFGVTGLAAVNTFAYSVLYGSSDVAISQIELTSYFQAYVDNVLLDDLSAPVNIETANAQFDDSETQSALRATLPALSTGFVFDGSLPTDNSADVYMSGDVTIDGDITVSASGPDAYAEVDLYGVTFNDSALSITSSGYNAYANLDVIAGTGTVSSLTVEASADYAEADVYMTAASGDVVLSVGDITVTASGSYASADVYLDGATVGNLSMNATGNSSNINASLTLTAGDVIAQTGVVMSTNSVATLEVNQTVHGGDVYAASMSGVTGDVVFNLTYTDATGDTITLGQVSDDVFTVGGFEGAFHLALSGNDQDYDVTTDSATLLNNMLTINGFDSELSLDVNDTTRNDTIEFLGISSGDYSEDLTDAGTIETFLTNAETALEGGFEAYFGVVGNNGYLAVDPDNVGVTQLIEFTNLTDFDSSRFITTVV